MTPEIPAITPELYTLDPTPHVPNSKLPVILYRVAVNGFSYDEILELMERNGYKKGGQWKEHKTAHFHSNVHECYAVISSSTLYSLGKSPIDPDVNNQGRKNGITLNDKATGR
ncbi:hypothetical protein BDV95DRAFT_574914 [Massariosphaeria phaeospora]|uniref:Uncharacterized protein n=1 Tax=Massariosphaeria phaeospora TaxID=100035 RepID=A0A7C8I5U9_9PLEO|nr:hypothetical protein BDV95DRAFT_574914 [Massariosphaeria phaeospora]